MNSLLIHMANSLENIIKGLRGVGNLRQQDCPKLFDQKENQGFAHDPGQSTSPGESDEIQEAEKNRDEVRPGFGSVCFAESQEVRDEYKDSVRGKE